MPHLNFFQDALAILISACILLICACVSCYEDGDEQGSRIPDHTSSGNFSGWRHFKVLQIPERCKYRSLTKCHINPDDHSNYQLNCFNGACKENETYFCLNGPKNNTIHACGPTKRCKKRHKDIFKHETHVKGGTLRVYTVECEARYFQPAYFQRYNWNCFTKCEKDESVVILQNATKDRPAVGRCNSHKNYCNGYDLLLFELGSFEDHCLHAELDLKIRCDKEEVLLPNCTCAVKCNIGTVRDWNDSLNCISKSAIQSATDTDISQLKSEPTTSASYQSSQITNQDKEEGSKMTNKVKNVPDIKRDSTDDVERKPTVVTVSVETTVLIVGACVSLLIFPLLAVILCVRKQGHPQRIRHSRTDNRANHHYNADTINIHNGVYQHLTDNPQSATEE